MKKTWIASPNWDRRKEGVVDAVVLHYTALPMNETIARFKESSSRVSAHFIIDRDGSVVQMVKTEERAWHAGPSRLEGREDVNDFSVGVELVNWGLLKKRGERFYVWKENWTRRYDGEEPVRVSSQYWEPYSEEQYDTVIELMKELRAEYPAITPERVKGHSEVCVPEGRKIDPGGAFDWVRLLESLFR